MGKKLILDEQKIVKQYLDGKSSLVLSNEYKISKPVILTILRKYNVVRKKDRCKSLKIIEEGEKYVVIRKCPKCNCDVKVSSNNPTITCRNYFNLKDSTCKKCSTEDMYGDKNPFYGKTHSNETKKKISNSRTGKATGNNNSMSNPKWRKKASTNLKKKWGSGDLDHLKKMFSEKMKETRRLGKLKSVNRSKKEKEIAKIIKKLGYDVKESFKVDTKICDIFIPKLNLIIEYNGDYWHCNPNKYEETYYNQKKNKTAKEIWEYDKNKIDLIRGYGYNLEVIWESDLVDDPTIINKLILNYVRK